MSIVLTDKPMPHTQEVERALLGAMLIDHRCISRVINIVEAKHFYYKKHQGIFTIAKELHQKGIPPDQVTMSEEILSRKLQEQVQPYDIAELCTEAATSANAEYHAEIVFEYAQRRVLIQQAYMAAEEAFDESIDIKETIEKSRKHIAWIQNREKENDEDFSTRLTLLEADLSDPEKIIEICQQIEQDEFQRLPEYLLQKLREHAQQLIYSANGKTMATLGQIKKILDDQETYTMVHKPVPFSQWLQLESQTISLVQKMIYEGEIHAFIGKPESGKTFFTTYLALALSSGLPVWDMLTQRSRILIVNQDTPETRQRARFRAIAQGHKILTPEIDRAVLHHYPKHVNLSDPTSHQMLSQFIQINSIDVLIIDTITDVLGDFEELNPQHINAIKKIFQDFGITVIFIQHANKTKGLTGTDLIRGAWAGVIDTAYKFEKTKGNNRFAISQIKQRNAPFKKITYTLEIDENFTTAKFLADHENPIDDEDENATD